MNHSTGRLRLGWGLMGARAACVLGYQSISQSVTRVILVVVERKPV